MKHVEGIAVQISALSDGELTDQELKQLLENFDDGAIQKWNDYQRVGDFLRSSDLAYFDNPSLLDKISAQIALEPTMIAPQLKTELKRRSALFALKGMFRFKETKSMAVSVAAVAAFAFGFYKVVPPLDAEIQMVRTQSLQNISESELALWQEYFMAHQQNSVRNGLAAVSPIARSDEKPVATTSERVIATSSEASDWMNVWEPSSHQTGQNVKFTYVSSSR
jgi:negative regulator of sigma E activity